MQGAPLGVKNVGAPEGAEVSRVLDLPAPGTLTKTFYHTV